MDAGEPLKHWTINIPFHVSFPRNSGVIALNVCPGHDIFVSSPSDLGGQ